VEGGPGGVGREPEGVSLLGSTELYDRGGCPEFNLEDSVLWRELSVEVKPWRFNSREHTDVSPFRPGGRWMRVKAQVLESALPHFLNGRAFGW